MKIGDLLFNGSFDINANIRIFEGGQWHTDSIECAFFSCGRLDVRAHRTEKEVLDSHITYMTTDDRGYIVIECDLE